MEIKQEHAPHVIVSLKVPELDETPLIVLSENANMEVKRNAFQSGANDSLTKPSSGKKSFTELNILLVDGRISCDTIGL